MQRVIIGLAALIASGCGGAGMGASVRHDISARMETVSSPLSSCYKTALEERRRLAGVMWVRFDIEPKSGQFTNVRITRSEIQNQGLESCVVQTVSGLRLEAPQSTVVSVDYPVSFTPTSP
jgi:TonB family protein